MGRDPGGTGVSRNVWNGLQIGGTDGTIFGCSVVSAPYGGLNAGRQANGSPNFFHFDYAGSSGGGLDFRPLLVTADSVSGGFAFSPSAPFRKHGLIFVDIVSGWSAGSAIGDVVLGQGFWLGENLNSRFPALSHASGNRIGGVYHPVARREISPFPSGVAEVFWHSTPILGGFSHWIATIKHVERATTTITAGKLWEHDQRH